jgi:hypothetical protein
MSKVEIASPVSCEACDQPLKGPEQAGWECECGVHVCQEDACFDEYFKKVGGGEAVRCRTCGHLA